MKKSLLFILVCSGSSVVAFSQTNMKSTEVYDNINKNKQTKEQVLPSRENDTYSLLSNETGQPVKQLRKLTARPEPSYSTYHPTVSLPEFRPAEYRYGIFLLHTPNVVRL